MTHRRNAKHAPRPGSTDTADCGRKLESADEIAERERDVTCRSCMFAIQRRKDRAEAWGREYVSVWQYV